MHKPKRLITAAAAAAALALAMAGCAGGSAPTPAAPTEYDGEPVTLEFWGSNAALKTLADKFNDAQDDITVNFTEQAGLLELATNVRNAHAAGNAPDIWDSTSESLTSQASEGLIADISELVMPLEGDYSEATLDAASAGGAYYGVPASAIPMFMVFNAPAFETAGLEYPTTWEQFVEDGKTLNEQGVKIMNLAGEDYTNYVYMAWQAGARWWELDGDTWTVDIDSAETQKGTDILQQLIDNDSVSKISFAEYAALMQDFNDGKIASRQLSTWQTRGMQSNLTTGLGQWEPAPNLEFDGDGEANVSFSRVFSVNSDSEHKDAAVFFAHWITTNEDAIETNASPVDGAAWFPAVADPTPYISVSEPAELLGEHAAEWEPVVGNAVKTQKGDWTYGPNATETFTLLADLWGKALAGEIRVADIAPELQAWVVDDLEQKGISVTEG